MAAVSDSLRALFDAEQGFITLALPSHFTYHVEFGEPAAQSYLEYYHSVDTSGAMIAEIPTPFSTEETRKSEAHCRLLASEIYTDWYVPNRLCRSVSMVAYGRLGPPPPGYRHLPDHLLATVLVSGSPIAQGPAAGRAATMLALLQPTFEASVRILQTAGTRTQELSAVVDGLGAAAWLFDATGACAHESAEAGRLLARLTEGNVLRAAVQQMARSLLAARRFGGPVAPSCSLTVGGCALSLVGAFVDVDHLPAVVVRVEGAPPAYPDASALRAKFGLTPQEGRVAVMRAERATAAEVAERLCLSVHTVRRHTERVMEKLAVHRAGDIGPALLGRAPVRQAE